MFKLKTSERKISLEGFFYTQYSISEKSIHQLINPRDALSTADAGCY